MNAQIRVATAQAGPMVGQTARAVGGIFVGIFVVIAALAGAVLAVALILALFSLITQHNIFGWMLPYGMPNWVAIVALVMLYIAIATPLRMIRHGGQGAYHPGWGALHGILWIGFMVLMFWGAYTFFPGVRELVDQLMWAANLTATTISETIV